MKVDIENPQTVLEDILTRMNKGEIVERKKGKWIITDIDIINRVWHCNCSECGEDPLHFVSGTEDWWLNKLPDYCPSCGAEMSEGNINDQTT